MSTLRVLIRALADQTQVDIRRSSSSSFRHGVFRNIISLAADGLLFEREKILRCHVVSISIIPASAIVDAATAVAEVLEPVVGRKVFIRAQVKHFQQRAILAQKLGRQRVRMRLVARVYIQQFQAENVGNRAYAKKEQREIFRIQTDSMRRIIRRR